MTDRLGNRAATAAGRTTRRLVTAALFLLLAALIFWAAGYLVRTFTSESTDDAFLDAHIVSIAPRISGQVTNVYVIHNQEVKTGDPLVDIDPRDWEAQLAAKQAGVSSAEANRSLIETSFRLMQTRVETAKLTARQAEADAAAAKAAADRARADFERAQGLMKQQIISQAEFDTAQAVSISAEAALRSAQEKVATEASRVKESDAQLAAAKSAYDQAKAQVAQSQADLRLTQLNLSYTRILAPVNGRVTRKNVEPGSYIQVGQPLMALVEHDFWIVANFKETQLANIRPGQRAEIEIDSVPGRVFEGRVDSIQAGSGARFSLLPPENAVGNYVKVVQRVPVKIVFAADPKAEHILGPGMSVTPSVITSDFQLALLFRVLIAVVLAALIVWIGAKIIAKRRAAAAP